MPNSVIEEYLGSVGFELDKDSLKNIQDAFGHVNKLFDNFQKNAIESTGGLNKLTEAAKKLNFVGKTVNAFKTGYNRSKDKTKSNNAAAFGLAPATEESALKPVLEGLVETLSTLPGLFVGVGVGLATLSASITAMGVSTAFSDLQNQKFAIDLMTTTKNARSLKAVMDTMGIKSIDELKYTNLIPEQRQQFLGLRHLAAQVQPGEDQQKGLQNFRQLGYEMQRVGLLFNFYWLDVMGTLGKMLEGPLMELDKWLHSFTDGFAKNFDKFSKPLAAFMNETVLWTKELFGIIGNISDLTGFTDVLKILIDLLRRFGLVLAGISEILLAGLMEINQILGPSKTKKPSLDANDKSFNLPVGLAYGATVNDSLPMSSGIASQVSAQQLASEVGGKGNLRSFAVMAAKQWGVNPAILQALIGQESGWNPNAVSRSGALGIAQFMPGTARGMGLNPLNPYESIQGAAKYLHNALIHYHGNYRSALASYNAGFGAVDKYGGVPPYKETQDYVKSIFTAASRPVNATIHITVPSQEVAHTVHKQLRQIASAPIVG